MPYANVNVDSWTTITTTTTDTVFQNKSAKPMFITSEATGGLSTREGFELHPRESIVYGTGHTVKASTVQAQGVIYYTNIGTV